MSQLDCLVIMSGTATVIAISMAVIHSAHRRGYTAVLCVLILLLFWIATAVVYALASLLLRIAFFRQRGFGEVLYGLVVGTLGLIMLATLIGIIAATFVGIVKGVSYLLGTLLEITGGR